MAMHNFYLVLDLRLVFYFLDHSVWLIALLRKTQAFYKDDSSELTRTFGRLL